MCLDSVGQVALNPVGEFLLGMEVWFSVHLAILHDAVEVVLDVADEVTYFPTLPDMFVEVVLRDDLLESKLVNHCIRIFLW